MEKKNSTKLNIMDAAKELFAEKGYNGVSMQDIADAVGISKGNLTYHFRKKENIMEALVAEAGAPDLPENPETVQQLDYIFHDISEVIKNKAYYFAHHAQLSQISDSIAEKQEQVYRANRNKFKNAFDNLSKSGHIHPEAFEGEYNTIIDALHMASLYLGPFQRLQSEQTDAVDYRAFAWNLMYRILTEKGRAELAIL